MSHGFSLRRIQRVLQRESADGWLFAYFQKNDPIAEKILELGSRFFTRRWFYFIPRRGSPQKIVHRIEPESLDHLPGKEIHYASWSELSQGLARALGRCRRVAMQYSPKNAVPYVSRVDAGTVELVRSLGVRVMSSGDLVQALEAPLTPAQWRQHQRTARDLREIVFAAFRYIRRKKRTSEYEVQGLILDEYRRRGLISNAPPIVAVNAHSAAPHYVPSKATSQPIRKGDRVLLDIWAKPKGPIAVYADITWCGYVGEKVPEKYERIFQIVRGARDSALELVRRRMAGGKTVRGWEVDRAARSYIERRGYGKHFIHRTGHSIGLEDHANGANMDGLETRETRRLIPGSLFSIEPGIYLKDFGVRSEIDVFIEGRRVRVSGEPVQERVVSILGLP